MILLDTHIFLWWQLEPEKLEPAHRRILDDTTSEPVAISIMTCWEIAILVRKNKIQLPVGINEWLPTVIKKSQIVVVDISVEIILNVFSLPASFHGDPADQLIVATAMTHQCPLLTMDRKILDHKLTRTG